MAGRRRSRSRRKRPSRSSAKSGSASSGEKDVHASSRSPPRGREGRNHSRSPSGQGRPGSSHRSSGKGRRPSRGQEFCTEHGKLRDVRALDPESYACVSGQRCRIFSEDTTTGIFREDGTEVMNPAAFFASGVITETFRNKFGTIIKNPIAYAKLSIKGKSKGRGKIPGKPAQDGSKSRENDDECARWGVFYKERGGHTRDHNPIGSKGHSSKGKSKDRSAPSNRKGSGRGASTHHPASHLPNKGIGKSQSSRGSDKQSRRHRRESSDPDKIDFDSISCADHSEQCNLIKTFSREQAREWLDEQKRLRQKQGAPFPLIWPLPTESAKHGGPDLESTDHFEPVKTWKSVSSRIHDVEFPGKAFCPGCWHKFPEGRDLGPIETRVIQHIESKIWDEDEESPRIPLHPSPAAWCHITANRISIDGPDTPSHQTDPGMSRGGIFADPSLGFTIRWAVISNLSSPRPRHTPFLSIDYTHIF